MIKKILLIVLLLCIGIIILFCYSACIISGRCSLEEEKTRDKVKGR